MEDVEFEIERLLDIPRRGTVVVGTVVSGAIHVGEVYELRGVRGRCDGIEIGRQLLTTAAAGQRVGVLLAAKVG